MISILYRGNLEMAEEEEDRQTLITKGSYFSKKQQFAKDCV
jgi:hypothetical protein